MQGQKFIWSGKDFTLLILYWMEYWTIKIIECWCNMLGNSTCIAFSILLVCAKERNKGICKGGDISVEFIKIAQYSIHFRVPQKRHSFYFITYPPDISKWLKNTPFLGNFWGTINEKWPTDICKPLFCGEGGIRTPGTSQFNGFQDRRNRPLCHLSNTSAFSLGLQR